MRFLQTLLASITALSLLLGGCAAPIEQSSRHVVEQATKTRPAEAPAVAPAPPPKQPDPPKAASAPPVAAPAPTESASPPTPSPKPPTPSPKPSPTPSPAPAPKPAPPPKATVTVTSITSPVRKGANATVRAETNPGDHCSIDVIYKSGSSKAQGLTHQQADGQGRVSWTWMVGTRTTPGSWPVIIMCDQGTARTSITVQ